MNHVGHSDWCNQCTEFTQHSRFTLCCWLGTHADAAVAIVSAVFGCCSFASTAAIMLAALFILQICAANAVQLPVRGIVRNRRPSESICCHAQKHAVCAKVFILISGLDRRRFVCLHLV